MKNLRHAEWGHWSITFWQRDAAKMRGEWDTYHPGIKVAEIVFPVGNCGPCDLPRRDEYRAAIKTWIDHGTVPATA